MDSLLDISHNEDEKLNTVDHFIKLKTHVFHLDADKLLNDYTKHKLPIDTSIERWQTDLYQLLR